MINFNGKGYKIKKWAVVLACLVKPEGKDEPILQNYVTGIDASTPRQATMLAIEAVWKEAFNRKELMPICGSKVYSWKQYEKLMREAAEAAKAEKKEELTPKQKLDEVVGAIADQDPKACGVLEFPKTEATDGVGK